MLWQKNLFENFLLLFPVMEFLIINSHFSKQLQLESFWYSVLFPLSFTILFLWGIFCKLKNSKHLVRVGMSSVISAPYFLNVMSHVLISLCLSYCLLFRNCFKICFFRTLVLKRIGVTSSWIRPWAFFLVENSKN